MDNCEPNFWNLGAETIAGQPERFVTRLSEALPFLTLPDRFTPESLFGFWDEVLEELCPVVFDKSPQYLGNPTAMDLLLRYAEAGNDVRIFAMIRDRESKWLRKYRHLESLARSGRRFSVFRYEDVSRAPVCYAPMIYAHTGCRDLPETYDHIRPTPVGRYSASLRPDVRRWRFSEDFKANLQTYGYPIPQMSWPDRIGTGRRMFRQNLRRKLRSVRMRLTRREAVHRS